MPPEESQRPSMPDSNSMPRQESKEEPRKRFLTPAIYRIAALLAVPTILAAIIWLTAHEQTVIEENVKKVMPGMTFDEVRAILGEPESIESVSRQELYRSGTIRWVSRPRHFFDWDVCSPFVDIYFEKSAVTHKQFYENCL